MIDHFKLGDEGLAGFAQGAPLPQSLNSSIPEFPNPSIRNLLIAFLLRTSIFVIRYSTFGFFLTRHSLLVTCHSVLNPLIPESINSQSWRQSTLHPLLHLSLPHFSPLWSRSSPESTGSHIRPCPPTSPHNSRSRSG
jgi:hypothetical protein